MKAMHYQAAASGKPFVIKYDAARWWVYHSDMLVARRSSPAAAGEPADESARLREAQAHVDRITATAT